MSEPLDGNAVVFCQGAFRSTNGKTAHGLVRFTRRYRVLAVVDSTSTGDAGDVLDGKPRGIPLVPDLAAALAVGVRAGKPATHFVIGLAPDGGRLPPEGRKAVVEAIDAGLHVDAGLHDFLSDDAEISARAASKGVRLRDVRKPPDRRDLHGWTGLIEQVGALKVASLGTDSAVGKRTTAWMLVDAFEKRGIKALLIGTGQTAWLQGAAYGIRLDSLINDFVAGELEWACHQAWLAERPQVLILEGQGSLMNPAYPGGFEILAACRPEVVVMQHAPARTEYDGFPGSPMHPIEVQIRAMELISGKPVVAVTVNQERIPAHAIDDACRVIEARTGLPTVAPLVHGVDRVVETLLPRVPPRA